MRKSKKKRKTDETSIKIELDLDGSGKADVDTGIPFFDHMLESFTQHGGFDLKVSAEGDLEVDYHHLIEDTGIVLGEALKEAIDKEKIKRFGFASIPMDEALSKVSLDFSGRNYIVCDFPNKKVSGINFRLFEHFFKSLTDNAKITLHIDCYGEDSHHIMESIFKAFAISLKKAVSEKGNEVRSTKGVL